MAGSPYVDLDTRAYWRTGVSRHAPPDLPDLYRKRFEISPGDRIATAGSCFAQHLTRRLRDHGYGVLDVEPPPVGLNASDERAFGYRLFSARYGNVYTTRQLLQLLREASGEFEPREWIWRRDGRHYDALRPAVEPRGLESPGEVIAHREAHLNAVRRLIGEVDVFVFTFGLTEAWAHIESGTIFPTAPGTIAGEFDPERFEFVNFTFAEVLQDFRSAMRLLQRVRPAIRFILTVSPVPLTATASGEHVLTATMYSKSVLRAVAGELYAEHPEVDYFPAYELVASHWSRASAFEDNLRSISEDGVAAVLETFLAEHSAGEEHPAKPRLDVLAGQDDTGEDDQVCEDALLDAFAK